MEQNTTDTHKTSDTLKEKCRQYDNIHKKAHDHLPPSVPPQRWEAQSPPWEKTMTHGIGSLQQGWTTAESCPWYQARRTRHSRPCRGRSWTRGSRPVCFQHRVCVSCEENGIGHVTTAQRKPLSNITILSMQYSKHAEKKRCCSVLSPPSDWEWQASYSLVILIHLSNFKINNLFQSLTCHQHQWKCEQRFETLSLLTYCVEDQTQ